jgi:hypothetical protein
LFAAWFERRLEEGFVEYIPAGYPRRIRRSIRAEEVTHFTFWTRWPRPFFPVLEEVLRLGYPVLWNVTITGLARTPVEPNVPATGKALAAIRSLATLVPPAAILWRYDPLLLSERYGVAHHLETFTRLADALAGRVDRIATSFVTRYGRRVEPDLRRLERETGDRLREPTLEEKVDLVGRLAEISGDRGLPLTVCCDPDLQAAAGLDPSGCNAFDWACRVYPALRRHRRLRLKPTRPGCACSEEFDIGVYDTCIYGCRYSYGSCNPKVARRNFRLHDPRDPCILPAG